MSLCCLCNKAAPRAGHTSQKRAINTKPLPPLTTTAATLKPLLALRALTQMRPAVLQGAAAQHGGGGAGHGAGGA